MGLATRSILLSAAGNWLRGMAFAAFAAAAALTAAGVEDCNDCHADPETLMPFTPGRSAEGLVVTHESLAKSVHEDAACSDCHVMAATEATQAHYEAGGTKPRLACGECHEEALRHYETGDIHGRRRQEGEPDAPWCNDCHGGHQILPVRAVDSPLSAQNQPDTCGRCHGTETLNTSTGGITKRRLVERYKLSVHWAGVHEGKPAATCSDCHGHHTILPSSDEASQVTRLALLTTCAKCHRATVQAYSKGSHGRTLLAGNLDVPTCTTCHGDHDIISLRVQPGGVRDFAATTVCIWCHGNERMMARYALDISPVQSYMRDFHGLAQRGSSGTAATCADCHDAHYSLPESHPESRMNLSNRGSTCERCHGESSESFIMSFTHKNASQQPGQNIVRWVRWIYVLLILLTIGGMLLHNMIIWLHFVVRKVRYQDTSGHVVRMNRRERLWHWVMVTAFVMLAVSGFALSFSDSAAFRWLYAIGLSEKARSWLHRVFAILLMVDMVLFFCYALISPRARRKWWVEMLPRRQDVVDIGATLAYHLGRGKPKPRYAVFNYAEKAEYWAMLWGTAVMVASGLILWFSTHLPETAPSWVVPVARAIHFYEAILAVSAIIVWHLFHTIYHPLEYPLNTSVITGKLTEHEARDRFTDEAVDAQLPPKRTGDDQAPERPEWLEE